MAQADPSEQDSYAGPVPDVSFSLDRSEILAGEALTCRITARWKPPLRVHPLSVPHELGSFEILDSSASPVTEKSKDGASEQTFTLKLTGFEAGEWELPPLEIPFSSEDGKLRTVRTAPQKITVKSYIEQIRRQATQDGATSATLRDIKPPLEIPMRISALAKAAAFILAAVGLAGLAVWLIRRFLARRTPAATPAPPLPPPDEEALQALARLELEDAARREKVKVLYSRLSYILRRYLGRRYAFDALEMTSSELLEKARTLEWATSLVRILEEDSAESDGVKFARYAPAYPLRDAALERARRLVLETRVVLPDAVAASGNGNSGSGGETAASDPAEKTIIGSKNV